MSTTTTTVVDTYLATLDEIGDAGLAAVLSRQLASAAGERFCFVVIERDDEHYTLAVDGAWALLALEFRRLQPDADLDMDLPRRAIRAVVRGAVRTDDRPGLVSPSVKTSTDGIPHVGFASID